MKYNGNWYFLEQENPPKREKEKKMDDPVNHPAHYTQGKIEVLDFIIDKELPYCLGNVVKYICRAPYKGSEIEDLMKAQFYLGRQIFERERDIK